MKPTRACQEHIDPNGTACGRPARFTIRYRDADGFLMSYPVCRGHALGIAMLDAQQCQQGVN